MSVVNLAILLVNVAIVVVVVQEDAVAAVHLDFAGVQVMGEGVTVLVGGPPGTAACHLVDVATAGHHLLTVGVRRCHMLMEMALGTDAEAEVNFEESVRAIIEGIVRFWSFSGAQNMNLFCLGYDLSFTVVLDQLLH